MDVPVNAILVTAIVAVIIALINIGSSVAFNVVTSLGTGTLTASYIITIGCVIWRRLADKPLLPSRFDMGKIGGLIVNFIAIGWLALVFVIAFFPPVPVPLLTLPTMNWSILVWGVTVLFALAYYLIIGRKHYEGPVEYVRKLQ